MRTLYHTDAMPASAGVHLPAHTRQQHSRLHPGRQWSHAGVQRQLRTFLPKRQVTVSKLSSVCRCEHLVQPCCSCSWRCRLGGWRTGTGGTQCCAARLRWAPSQVRARSLQMCRRMWHCRVWQGLHSRSAVCLSSTPWTRTMSLMLAMQFVCCSGGVLLGVVHGRAGYNAVRGAGAHWRLPGFQQPSC
jgi:hypothetical protein